MQIKNLSLSSWSVVKIFKKKSLYNLSQLLRYVHALHFKVVIKRTYIYTRTISCCLIYFRDYCTEEKRKEIARKVAFMYSALENFLECDEYTEDLRIELNESYPDYLKTLQKRRKDMEHTDHGIIISGLT